VSWRAVIGSACLAVALGGCSLTPSSSASSAGFTGQAALVASTLNTLASDASSGNGADICKTVLDSSVRATLNKLGSCATILDNQLKTVDDFTLTVKAVKITGSTATASVQTVRYRVKVTQTVSLKRESGAWRLASASAV
jgi:hypothetical protein